MSEQPDLFAIVLPSGIGVRFQDLDGEQSDAVLLAAAKQLPQDGTVMEMTQIEAREGVAAMIKQVTRGPCLRADVNVKPEDRAAAEQAIADAVAAKQWAVVAASAERLQVLGTGEYDPNHPQNVWVPWDPDADGAYKKTFPGSRDHSVLKQIYQYRTRVSGAEVAAILGKAVKVAR